MKFGKVRRKVSGREGKNNNASPVIFDDELLKRRLSFGPNKFSGDAVPAKHALFRDSSGPKIKEKRPYFGDDTTSETIRETHIAVALVTEARGIPIVENSGG